ncbi:MAG: hypothetical protein ABFD98_15865 [Syntrophobacteraceae bacterium]
MAPAADKKRTLGKVPIERDLLTSKAWLTLPPGIAPQIYLLFRAKMRMEKINRKGGKWVCVNNGELVFPYRAAEKLGITGPRFQRAIDSLVEHGLLDIAEPGNATARECTKYAVSERWREFGRPNFEHRERSKERKGGSINPFGRNRDA